MFVLEQEGAVEYRIDQRNRSIKMEEVFSRARMQSVVCLYI